MGNLRVLLADDHAVVREGLKTLLNIHTNMETIGEAATGPDAVRLTNELDPDVVIVSASLSDPSGAPLVAQLRASRPDRKVLVLATDEGTGSVLEFLEAGASGYVLKRAAAPELVRAIRAVADGQAYLDPTLSARTAEAVRPAPEGAPSAELSEREAEVLRLIALGYSNKEIAAQLEVSVKTIETYKTRSMEKLQIRSRVEIVRYAIRRGWFNSA